MTALNSHAQVTADDAHPPKVHASTHEDGGTDELEITSLATSETDDTLVLAPDGLGGVEFRAETGGGGGGSITAVTVALTTDRAITGDSAYHDIPDLAGIALTAGTWIGLIDIAMFSGGDCAFNIKVIDATPTTYAEQEFVYKNVASILSSFHFHIAPFVLAGSQTLKLQGWSGINFTVKKFADQGTSPSSVLSKVTFLKIA